MGSVRRHWSACRRVLGTRPGASRARLSRPGPATLLLLTALAQGVTLVPAAYAQEVRDNDTSASILDGSQSRRADVQIRLVGRERAFIGEVIGYEVRVRNVGPDPAEGVEYWFDVPDGGAFVSSTGGHLDDGGRVRFPGVAKLAAGAAVYDTVHVRYDEPGRFVTRGRVEAATQDPDHGNNEDTEPTTVSLLPKADLQIVKEGPAMAQVGDTVRYLITATNLGPDLADWIDIIDYLPEGSVFVKANRQHTVENGVVTWHMIHIIEPGASVQDTVWVMLPEPGTYVNTASFVMLTDDPNPENDTSSVVTVVKDGPRDEADVAVSLRGRSPVQEGETVEYDLTVTNNGPDEARGVRFRYRVPDGGEFVDADGGGALNEDGWVRWPEVDRLSSGSEIDATVRVRYDEEGRYRNRAAVESDTRDEHPGNNTVTLFTDVVPVSSAVADLEVVKSGPLSAAPGDTVEFVITTTNLGPDPARDVVVSDELPTGVELVSATGTFDEDGPVLRWDPLPVLEVGAAVQDTVRIGFPDPGSYVNTARVTGATADPDPINNEFLAPIDVGGLVDLALVQTVMPGSVAPGDPATFLLTVSNVGADATVGPATVTSRMPEELTYQTALSVSGGWTFSFDGMSRDFEAVFEGPIEPGTETSFEIRVIANPGVETPSEAVHRVTVATALDENPSNDVDSDTLRIARPLPAIDLTKRALVSEATAGDLVTYVLGLVNRSTDPATEVALTDRLPDGFRLKEGSVRLDGRPIEDPDSVGTTLEIAVGRIEPGEERTLTYRLVVSANTPTGPARNQAIALDRPSGVSDTASATVQVLDDGVFTEEGLIVGKVYAEVDSMRLGIPGVRIFLQDGTAAITDAEGNYNFVGLRPQLWVVRVDQSTLPEAMELKPITARHAGRGTSVFADLVRGEMHRVDFGAYETEADSLWHLTEEDVHRRRNYAAKAEEDRGGGVTWPLFNGWVRDSTATGTVTGTPSSFGEVLPEWSLNAGNSGLGPRPADPIAAGIIGERATQDGPLRLTLGSSARTIADGERTVPVTVAVDRSEEATQAQQDADGAVVVTLEASRGRWEARDLDPVAPGLQIAVRGEETVMLRAPPTPGDGMVRATALNREAELVVPWVGDHRRPFLVTGLIEGQVDGRSLETAELVAGRFRDRLQDPLEEITFDSDDGRYSGGLRAAAFATGDIGDETTLTVRFDTEKDGSRRFFEDIRPEDFYGVYGDASLKSFGAQSRGRVFGAIERGRSFLMYGDYLTGAGQGEAQALGRYSRTLNGFAQHYEGGMGSLGLRIDGFASYDRASQVVDEIRGMGISGPYELSRTDALLNSEQVEILVRDRNQPSIILRRERLTRFLDYSVEPFTGRLLFKRPIPSLDDQLNPVSVRVIYEVEARGGDRFWVYGVDGALQASGRLELGGGMVRDENDLGGIDLSSGNATLGLTDNTFLFGEFARSDSAQVQGDARRVELRHASGRIDARAYFVETDSTFSNPSSGFDGGRREVGLRGRADLTARLQLLGEALRTESLLTGGEREGGQIALRFGRAWSAEVGYRYAEEVTPASVETADAVPYDLNSVRARLTAPLPEGADGAVFAEYEQDVNDSEQRRLVIGGDVRLFDRARLYGRHELISSLVGPYGLNPLQEQNNTVFGIAADYKAGTQVFSEYRARDAFEGREAQAAMGLRNQWSVADGIRLNTSFERLSPLGTEGRDALAVTGGLEYTANPLWKGTVRGEYRSAGDEDHILGSLGYAGRLTEDWTLLGRTVFSHVLDGPTYERSRLGVAYRDIESNKWNSLFRYEHRYDQEPREDLEWNRTAHVFSTHFDYRPADRFTFRGQYGAKYVTEQVEEEEEDGEPASLLGARIIYDLGAHFDVGLTGWALRTGSLVPAGGSFSLDDAGGSPQNRYALGAELGWSPVTNLRIAGGYNAFGFIDDDLVPDQPTDHGFYVRVGYKLDGLWGDEPDWQDPPADVAITKLGPDKTVVERPTEYWMYPRNQGPYRARGVEVQDELPPGSQVLEASEGAVVVGDTIRWHLGNLEPGDGPSLFVRLTYPDTGVAVNEARIEGTSPDPDRFDNVASQPTQVVPYELRIEKFGPDAALPDEPVTYTISVTNVGPRAADEVIVTDSLPVGGVFQSARDGGTHVEGVVTWPSRPLGVGETTTYGLTATYPLAGRYENVTRVNAPIEPDRAVHTVEIGLQADARLTLFGKERAVTGDTVRYRLHVYNSGPGTARNARAQVVVPPRGRVVSMDSTATEFGGRVAWSLGSMAPGEDRALELDVVFDSVGLYPVEARVFTDFDEDSETDRAVRQTRVYDWDLDVQLTDSIMSPDGLVEYVIRVANRGPGPAPFVVVEDSIAQGGQVEYASRGGVDDGDVVRWPELDELPGGATHIDTVAVRYDLDGVYPNTASASADGYTVSDRVESLVGLHADMRVDKLGLLLATAGDTIEYALHVYNAGTGVARGVEVVDEVPAGARLIGSTGDPIEGEEGLTWALGELQPADEAFLTYTVIFPDPGLFLNRVRVSSGADPDPRNDVDELATRIDAIDGMLPSLPSRPMRRVPVDSLIVVATGPDVTRAGRSNEYEAFVSNRGFEPLSDVRLTVSVPAGVSVDSVMDGGTVVPGSIEWDVGAMGTGGEAFGRFFLTFPAEGRFEVAAVVSGRVTADDTDLIHGDTVTTDVVAGSPTLGLDGTAAALEDETVTYVITLGIEGTGPLAGVVVEDSLPDGAEFLRASRGGRLQGRVVRWPPVTLTSSDAPVTDTVEVTYARRGRYVNRVTTSPRFPGARDEIATLVGQAADVRVALQGPDRALVADTSLYYLQVYNAGNGRARGVETEFILATGSRLVSVTEGGVVDDQGRITWPVLETMEPGAELFPMIEIAYDRPGTYRHRTSVSSEFDPDLVNASDDLTTRVLSRRLDVRLRGPVEVDARDTLSYVVETTYRGPGRVEGGYVEEVIPPSATFLGASGNGTQQEGVVRWPLTEGLESGVTRADTLRVLFPFGGLYTHVATAAAGPLVTSDTLDVRVHPLTDPTPSVVYFDFDQDTLKHETRADLIQIAQQLRFIAPRIDIALVGHADTVGASDYNDRLGQRRADRVEAFLDSLGVRTTRMEARTRGELEPVSTEGTRASHAKDRRVVFHYCDPLDPETSNRWPCNQFLSGGSGGTDDGEPAALAPPRGPPVEPPRPRSAAPTRNEHDPPKR